MHLLANSYIPREITDRKVEGWFNLIMQTAISYTTYATRWTLHKSPGADYLTSHI